MENGKKLAGSSSSSTFTNDLFGSNVSDSSSGVFGSIFAPPSNSNPKFSRRDGYGYGYGHGSDSKKRDDFTGRPDKAKEGEEGGQSNVLDSIFEGERGFVHQPCNLSSSIYYGGQDMYFSPAATQSSSSYKKNGEDDDPHSASRGEWWQGSVYY